MSFIDVIFKILSEGYSPAQYGGTGIAVAMVAAELLSLYIFLCYRFVGRRSFYSFSYSLSLLGAGPVTCALILLMHQNAIAGIGVVGALSIIRLRGAVKEPMDLVFVLWSVAGGIFIASGMWRVGILVSIIMTAVVILLDLLPLGSAPLILSIYGYPGRKTDLKKVCGDTLYAYCSRVKFIARGKNDGKQNISFSIRTKQRIGLMNELAKLPEVESVTIVEQSGEVSF